MSEQDHRRGWEEAIAALRDGDRRAAWLKQENITDPCVIDYSDYLEDLAPKATEHDHRRAGPGYWSPLCMYRWDGCTDERCVCACHNRAPAETPPLAAYGRRIIEQDRELLDRLAADKPKEEPQ